MQGGSHDQRDPTSHAITQGADDKLSQGKTDGGGGQGHLHLGVGDSQVGFEGREGGQVQVYGEGAKTGQQAERDDGRHSSAHAELVSEWLWHANSAECRVSRASK